VPLRQIRREKYEGRGKKRCGMARTDETRKWYERPRCKIEGNGDPSQTETLVMIKFTEPLRLAK